MRAKLWVGAGGGRGTSGGGGGVSGGRERCHCRASAMFIARSEVAVEVRSSSPTWLQHGRQCTDFDDQGQREFARMGAKLRASATNASLM